MKAKAILPLLVAIALVAQQPQQPKTTNQKTDVSDALKAQLAVAQRNYQIVKAAFDVQLAQHPATAALQAAMRAADEVCRATGKQTDFDGLECVAKPAAAGPAAAK